MKKKLIFFFKSKYRRISKRVNLSILQEASRYRICLSELRHGERPLKISNGKKNVILYINSRYSGDFTICNAPYVSQHLFNLSHCDSK